MNFLCLVADHSWAPANPKLHDFVGTYCPRCNATKVLHRDNATRRAHYLAKQQAEFRNRDMLGRHA